jgi:hypothetical protein
MFNPDITKSRTLTVSITYDENAAVTNPDRCVLYRVEDAFGNLIHNGNDFSQTRDEDLATARTILSIIQETVLKPEIHRRHIRGVAVNREIENLTKS